MTLFIDFNGSLINPELVYRIDRVTATVTITILVGAVPPTLLLTEDFVFADEATAIAALDTFVTASGVPLEIDLVAAVTQLISITNDPLEMALVAAVEQSINITNDPLEIKAVEDTLTLAEAVQAVTAGLLANQSQVQGALNNLNLGTSEQRTEKLIQTIIASALKLVEEYEAVP